MKIFIQFNYIVTFCTNIASSVFPNELSTINTSALAGL